MATSEKLTKETFNPDALDWRDLGLPSGNLWMRRPLPFTYSIEEAREAFGEYLPTMQDLLELKRETKIKNLGSSAEFKGKNKQGVLLSMGWRFITDSVFQDGKHILAFRPVKDYYKPELTFIKEEMPRFKFQNSFKVLLCKRSDVV